MWIKICEFILLKFSIKLLLLKSHFIRTDFYWEITPFFCFLVFTTTESQHGGKNIGLKFEKLKIMAYIVSMEKLNDIIESWNEGAILHFTVGDVKKICLMRIDFEKDEVEKMCLR